MEGTSRDPLVPANCSSRLTLSCLLSTWSSWVFSISKDGASTASLGNLFLFLTLLTPRFAFNFTCLICALYLLHFSLVLLGRVWLPLHLLPSGRRRTRFPTALTASSHTWDTQPLTSCVTKQGSAEKTHVEAGECSSERQWKDALENMRLFSGRMKEA